MVQIKCLSNGLYSLKNSHIPFGMGFQPPPPYGGKKKIIPFWGKLTQRKMMIEVLDHDDDSCNDTRGRGKSLNYRVTHSYHCTALYPMTMMLVIVTKTNDDDFDVYHGCSYFHGCHSTIENCQPLKTCSHNLTTKAGQKIISAQFLPKVNWKWLLPPISSPQSSSAAKKRNYNRVATSYPWYRDWLPG